MADSSDLLGSLLQQLGGDGVAQIARSAGVSGGDVTNVLAGAVPAMMSGLTRNAASPSAMDMVARMLDGDGDGDSMDDIAKIGTGLLGKLFGGGR